MQSFFKAYITPVSKVDLSRTTYIELKMVKIIGTDEPN